jgi:VanZ family protein
MLYVGFIPQADKPTIVLWLTHAPSHRDWAFHLLSFALLTFLIHLSLQFMRKDTRYYLLLFCSILWIAGVSEFLQGALSKGRNRDWMDFAFNGAGIFIGIFMSALRDRLIPMLSFLFKHRMNESPKGNDTLSDEG